MEIERRYLLCPDQEEISVLNLKPILSSNCLRARKNSMFLLLKTVFNQISFVTGRKEFLANASLAFDNKREDNLREKLAEERKEKAEYAKKVGQLTMQVDWLKKKSEEIVGPDYESKFSPKPFDD